MWTPKRILLAVASFLMFFTSYEGYAYFLGGIDGLPPLPEHFFPQDPDDSTEPTPPRPPEADRKLKIAFGDQSDEVLKRSIKLDVRSKNVVLATDQFEIEKEGERAGQVRLEPFSVAIEKGKPGKGDGKTPKPDGDPEITTVRARTAYLTFDRPISTLNDLNGAKIVAGELTGKVEMVNNRKTLLRDDDLSLQTNGPVFYDEAKHLVWTAQPVRLTDPQSKPEPTEVTGVGLYVYLTPETGLAQKPPPGPRKSKQEGVSGVEKVVLQSTVAMYLWVDSKSGFLSSNKPEPAQQSVVRGPSPVGGSGNAPAAANGQRQADAPAKCKVVITTEGPFTYDLITDRARFDIAPGPDRFPNNVVVTRIHNQEKRDPAAGQERPTAPVDQGKRDQLICDHLELQFHRKPPPASGPREDRSADLEIETAHATGTQVILSSDAELLEAYGNDLLYDARVKQSVLKGEPMQAVKDGHKIEARELTLEGTGQKELQQARAKGPGKIDLFDREKNQWNAHAVWGDLLTYGKDKDGTHDCLTLTGNASFRDDERKQELRAQRIQVWLKPAPQAPAAGNAAQRVRPDHIEATGHVSADSPELRVQDSEHLVVWIRDQPEGGKLPSAVPDGAGQPAPGAAGGDRAAGAGQTPGGQPPAPGAGSPEKPKEKQKKPINLSARIVKADLTREGNKNDLDKLWCEGTVLVRQDPATPEEQGVDIRGDTLQLSHFADGNVLVVTGSLAMVQLDKLTIHGPEVNIDQRINNAWVNGIGAMQMPASSDLQMVGGGPARGNLPAAEPGKKPPQPPGELTVHWNKGMFFNGNCAEFHGGVQAEQGTGRLACQEMQVFLDRPVSFREGEKRGQTARVQTLVCDKNVRIEDAVRDGDRYAKLNRLSAPEVTSDNGEGVVTASGPGVVIILQMGNAEDGFLTQPGERPAPNGATAKPAKEEMKLTRVNYLGHLHANNKTRVAIFYDGVEVTHVPAENPDLVVDVDRPPPGCMHLKCEQLKVFKAEAGQEMEARKRVTVRAREFWGTSEVLKYDEAKELVVLEGGESGVATLWRAAVPGQPPSRATGKKILYWRKTHDFKVESGGVIDAQK